MDQCQNIKNNEKTKAHLVLFEGIKIQLIKKGIAFK